jgi:cytochrome c-type biogenesis protein
VSGGGLAETFQSIALSGSLMLAVAVAAIAGLIAFLSPCVLPIVPGYLGYVSGLAGQNTGISASPRKDPGTGRKTGSSRFVVNDPAVAGIHATVFAALVSRIRIR